MSEIRNVLSLSSFEGIVCPQNPEVAPLNPSIQEGVPMNILWKCCKRTLKENQSRTIVTILGVALATGLITAVACLGVSLIASYTEYVKQTEGDAHVIFSGVSGKDIKRFLNNQSVEELWIARRDGYAKVENPKNSDTMGYISILSVTQDWFDHHDGSVKLIRGRLPEKENEIVIDRLIRSEVGMELSLGDEITLSVGDRTLGGQKMRFGADYDEEEILQPRFEKNYVVVGFTDGSISELSSRFWDSRHTYKRYYTAISCLSEDEMRKELEAADENVYYNVSLRYQKSVLLRQEELTAGILGISRELYHNVWCDWKHRATEEELLAATEVAKNVEAKDEVFGLMHLESGQLINQRNYQIIYLIALGFLILAYAGVFCINNSFDLTFTERVRFYGLMSSIGTTKSQRRKLVLLEGVVIGAYGIPLGLLIGTVLTFLLVKLTNLILRMIDASLQFHMMFRVNLTAFLLGSAVSVLMIFLSAWESAVRASKVSPIAAIRSNEEIKVRKEKKRRKRLKPVKRRMSVSGRLAVLNFDRAKIKYRASVASIAVSIALFLGISLISMLFSQFKDAIWEETNCQLRVTASDEENWREIFDSLKGIAEDEAGVTRAEIVLQIPIIAESEDIPYLLGKPAQYANDSALTFLNVMDEKSFALCCKDAGIEYEKAKGKGIVSCLEVLYVPRAGAALLKDRVVTGERFATFRSGDVLHGSYRTYTRIDDGTEGISGAKWETHDVWTEVEIAGQVDDTFALIEPYPSGYVMLYVGESWLSEHPEVAQMGSGIHIEAGFLADDVNALEDAIMETDRYVLFIENYDKDYRKLQYTEILIKMFLLSFMFIISMIGITNVINAIGTNMELRSQEFARLRSIGMTGGQLRHMVRTEMGILGGKGMLYGILIGTGISYALYRFLWESSDKSYEFAFRLPILEAAICIVLVSLLLALITERRIRKMERRNIVETLRNENL
ncbi:MAG: ABC transporter permease [Lachnospiraceae bacterium]|nr:ABC transporter permease [Lachnospiraceae bacterium]